MNPSMAISLELLLAVLVASVMGSLHCVGMCGPFALWASGAGTKSTAAGVIAARITLYHLGRLTTYLIGGGLVGLAGAVLSAGGSVLGFQSAAARVAGIAMVSIGIVRLLQWTRGRRRILWEDAAPGGLPSAPGGLSSAPGRLSSAPGPTVVSGGRIAAWLASLRPSISRLQPLPRSYVTGGLTTLLPCGWLYLFLIVAGGTGTVTSSVAVMFAFWIGTLPALTSLMLGALRFAPAIRPALPLVGSLLLLVTGLYTATGRASADLSILSDRMAVIQADSTTAGVTDDLTSPPTSLETLNAVSNQPLPCCPLGD